MSVSPTLRSRDGTVVVKVTSFTAYVVPHLQVPPSCKKGGSWMLARGGGGGRVLDGLPRPPGRDPGQRGAAVLVLGDEGRGRGRMCAFPLNHREDVLVIVAALHEAVGRERRVGADADAKSNIKFVK